MTTPEPARLIPNRLLRPAMFAAVTLSTVLGAVGAWLAFTGRTEAGTYLIGPGAIVFGVAYWFAIRLSSLPRITHLCDEVHDGPSAEGFRRKVTELAIAGRRDISAGQGGA